MLVMIVISCSLDSSLERAKYQGTFSADMDRYRLFENFGGVVLLTQDTKSFITDLNKIKHVPCAFSKFEIIRKTLSQRKYVRWFYCSFSSFFWLLRNRGQVVCVITENVDSPSAFLFSLLSGVPFYIHYHYDVATQIFKVNKSYLEGILLLFLEKLCFKKADCVWVTAANLADKAKEFGAKKVTLLPNWVDFDTEVKKPVEENDKSRGRILFVGRLHPVKRVNLLLEAFAQLRKINPEVCLSIVGDGDGRQNLMALAKDLGLFDSVQFLGFQNHETVLDIMKQSDMIVLPSKMEGNPKVLIEAMMLRVPIVGTNVPGIRDIIRHGETGHLASEASALNLALSMDYVLRSTEYAHKIAENAYEFAKSQFSKKKALKRIREDLLVGQS